MFGTFIYQNIFQIDTLLYLADSVMSLVIQI